MQSAGRIKEMDLGYEACTNGTYKWEGPGDEGNLISYSVVGTFFIVNWVLLDYFPGVLILNFSTKTRPSRAVLCLIFFCSRIWKISLLQWNPIYSYIRTQAKTAYSRFIDNFYGKNLFMLKKIISFYNKNMYFLAVWNSGKPRHSFCTLFNFSEQ